MVGWHHQLSGYEFEQASGLGDGQGSLACYSPCGHQELDMTERLDGTEVTPLYSSFQICFRYSSSDILVCLCVLSCLVMSDSLQPHGL